jgi:hypothetical protein
MKLNDVICFKPPTLYDILMSVGLIVILFVTFAVHATQTEMQKDYVTKDYIYNFYITKDQFQIIENERPKYMQRVRDGENIQAVTLDYNTFVDRIISLRIRGLDENKYKPK